MTKEKLKVIGTIIIFIMFSILTYFSPELPIFIDSKTSIYGFQK